MVANNADGNISLFQPGDNGLALTSVLSSSGLPNPSGLALASFSGANLEFYATNDGEASASLLGFQLAETTTTTGLTLSEAGGSAQLLSLNDTSLALVGTLLTLTLEMQDESEQSSEDASAVVASAGPGASGQSLLGRSRTPDDSEELEDTEGEPAVNATPALSWTRFVVGLDQAIEAIRKEIDARLLQEEQPAKADDADTTLFDQDDAARPADTTSSREQSRWGDEYWLKADDDWIGAVDMAIDSLGSPKSSARESVFPVLPDSTITKSSKGSLRVIELRMGATLFPSVDVDQPDRVEDKLARDVTVVAIPAIAIAARERLRKRAVWRVRAERSRAGRR